MKVRDEGLWQLTKSQLLTDGMAGVEMIGFVEDWATAAEGLLAQTEEFQQEDGSWSGPDPAQALRVALPGYETRYGVINTSALAQGLIILLANWAHGDQIYRGLTCFERKLVDDVLSLKQLELAKAASIVPG